MPDELPVPLREVLASLGGSAPIEHVLETARLWQRWDDVVGPAIAGHAEPTSFRDRVLRVRADSPAWATEIGYLSGEIRRRANELLGRELVREVRVWTGPGTGPPHARATGASLEGERASRRASAPAADPAAALERARAAWSKSAARTPPRARGEPGHNGKKPW